MEKRAALIISVLITLVIAGNYLFFYDFSSDREDVIVKRVIDGDTLELEDGRTIRLINVNTPERGRAYSDEAKEFLEELENRSVQLETLGVGSYGRVLGRIFAPDYINLEIVKRGFGHTYLIQESETFEFKEAEEEAREAERGMWEKSEFYGCLDVEIHKYDEYVFINVNCNLDIQGWSVKDESTKRYVFSENFERVKLYSEEGEDNSEEVYWGRGNVWNDECDSIFIRDSGGKLVYYNSYDV